MFLKFESTPKSASSLIFNSFTLES